MELHKPYIDSLLSFRLSDLTKDLKNIGHSLDSLETLLKSGDYVKGRRNWIRGEDKVGSISYRIIREDVGLSLELRYSYSIEEGTGNQRQRYSLVKRESNLIPGKYRYYIQNPYTKEDSLCSILYLCRCAGSVGFYPRSILNEKGYLYKQQRESHTGRYVWSMCERANRKKYTDLRHRKSHYRGKPTPFWTRYLYVVEESERRLLEELIKANMIGVEELRGTDIRNN